MHPLLIKIAEFSLFGINLGPFEIHTYGAMMALAFIASYFAAVRAADRSGEDREFVLDIVLWSMVTGLLGSRILYVIINAGDYYSACFDFEQPNPLHNNLPFSSPACFEWIKMWNGGLVWYGGFIGATLFFIIFCLYKKRSFLATADLIIPAVALGHSIGRIGCFFAGCCWGGISASPLAVRFPRGSMAFAEHVREGWISIKEASSLPVHPTQLYESAANFIIFLVLLSVLKNRKFKGQVLLTYFFLYAPLRILIEFLRGDRSRGLLISWSGKAKIDGRIFDVVSGFSTSQIISMLLLIAAVPLVIFLARREYSSNSNATQSTEIQ